MILIISTTMCSRKYNHSSIIIFAFLSQNTTLLYAEERWLTDNISDIWRPLIVGDSSFSV